MAKMKFLLVYFSMCNNLSHGLKVIIGCVIIFNYIKTWIFLILFQVKFWYPCMLLEIKQNMVEPVICKYYYTDNKRVKDLYVLYGIIC